MKRKKLFMMLLISLSLFIVNAYTTVSAGVTAEEAAKLKTTLTPFGAERAGNSDGTIPAWEGGITEIPAGYKLGDRHIDPFADDKVLFIITAANMEQYADKLAEGQKELLRRYPDTYKINVYRTRRSHSAPQWVYDNTFKNATRASITEDGYGVIGAFGGIAFPIPKRAEEVMWNFLTRWMGTSQYYDQALTLINPGSPVVRANTNSVYEKYPYYDQDLGFDQFCARKVPEILLLLAQYSLPVRRKGEIILAKDPLDQSCYARKAWQYLPGQRRVRRAPTIAYDTPGPGTSGIQTYDDTMMFNGAIDRYDWKLIGKKEMYIPYNCYKAQVKLPIEELILDHHPKPEYWRWELHRVWVVEGTLREGKRHIYAKRVNYIDEDSWAMAMRDVYDAQGSLWRHAYAALKNAYELPGIVQRPNIKIDFFRPEWLWSFDMTPFDQITRYNIDVEEEYFTPENVRRLGRR